MKSWFKNILYAIALIVVANTVLAGVSGIVTPVTLGSTILSFGSTITTITGLSLGSGTQITGTTTVTAGVNMPRGFTGYVNAANSISAAQGGGL